MDGEEARAALCHAFDALRHRMADVVKFQIEKDALAGVNQGGHITKPAGISELIADLVERHRIAELCHHGLRRFDRRQIERDDQALARLHRH